MAMTEAEHEGARMEDGERRTDSSPPTHFLRPGYLTTAGNDELRARAEQVLREHRADLEEAEEREQDGASPPTHFLRPGYLTTAGSDELRDRAEEVLREHRAEMEGDEDLRGD